MLGPIVVTGGTGFVGAGIVKALLQRADYGTVISVSRKPPKEPQPGVQYRLGDITDSTFVQTLLHETKATAIIHTASLMSTIQGSTAKQYFDTNVNGVKVLLQCATDAPTVRAFVYTSSVNVIEGDTHFNAAEDSAPYWPRTANAIPYWRSKAAAEPLVLQASSAALATAAIRLCMVVGEGDPTFIPGMLQTLTDGKHTVQLGDNTNMIDTVSVQNSARAHLLALRCLLGGGPDAALVAGQAFNVSDGDPLHFWDLCRMVWRAAGDTSDPAKVKVVPAWLAMGTAGVSEVAMRLWTLGRKEPLFNRHVVHFCTTTFTYDIGKAKKVLGYVPEGGKETVIREAVEMELRRREVEKKESSS